MLRYLRQSLRSVDDGRFKIHWQQYRDFFSIQILKYFVVWFAFVPVIAVVFQTVPGEVRIGGEPPIILHIGLPFNWALLWIASLFYTVALLVYAFLCPPFVRKYHSYKEYQDEQHSPRWIAWIASHAIGSDDKNGAAKLVNRLLTKKYLAPDPSSRTDGRMCQVFVEQAVTRMVYRKDDQTYSLAMPILDGSGAEDPKRTAEVAKDAFWEVFAHYARSRLWARLLILVLLTGAFIFFMVVFVQHIWSGLPYVLNEMNALVTRLCS